MVSVHGVLESAGAEQRGHVCTVRGTDRIPGHRRDDETLEADLTVVTRYRFYTATTLDGFLADENDSLEWLFTKDIDETGPGNAGAFMEEVGAQVMGATTYLWVLDHEPHWLPQIPTFVFTHRSLKPVNGLVEFLSGDPSEFRELIGKAAGDRDVWITGGGDLAAYFASAGMLDEVQVSIAPVLLGAGKPLFGGAVDLSLRTCDRNRDFLVATFDVIGPLAPD